MNVGFPLLMPGNPQRSLSLSGAPDGIRRTWVVLLFWAFREPNQTGAQTAGKHRSLYVITIASILGFLIIENSAEKLPQSKPHVFNAGGPVWGLDWCPIHPNERGSRGIGSIRSLHL